MKEKWKHWEQVFWHKVEKGLPFLLALVPIHAMLLCFRPDGILLSSATIALFGSLGILLFLQGSIMQDMANMQMKVETMAKGILAKEQAKLVLVSKEELQQMDGQPIYVVSKEYAAQWCVVFVEEKAALIPGADRKRYPHFPFSEYGKSWDGYRKA